MDMNGEYSRLRRAFEYSRDKMTPFRQRRYQAITSYVGGNYGDGQGEKAHPVNLLQMAIGIYRRSLAARRPSVTVKANSKERRGTAKKAEMMLNSILEEMRFEDALSRVVLDALFSIGVTKIGLTPSKGSEMQGVFHDAGLPFADCIDLDDLVIDMRAKTWETIQFVGNRFIVPKEMAIESGLYDFGKDEKMISESRTGMYNEYGDTRVEAVSRSTDSPFEDTRMTPVLEMWEMYLPYEGKVCTFLCDDRGVPMFDREIREVEWDGPEHGPYHILSLEDVPGQVMPVGPAASLVDLSEAMNRTMRKLVRQNDRSKTVGIVAAGAEDDGERIISANDGDMIRSDRPEATREIRFGGAEQGTLAFALQLRDMFNYMGGNLDTIGGLAAAADTLGQEQLIKQSSSQKVQDMQARVTKFTGNVVKSIGLWAWYDPARTYMLTEDLGNTGIEVQIPLKPKDRKESEFFDLQFSIRPSSLQETTSADRVQAMSNLMNNFLLPMAPTLMQQGVQIDVPAYVGHMANLTGVEEIADLITPMGTPLDPDNMIGIAHTPPQQGKPPVTKREYIRRNVPTGGTRTFRDNAMSQMLMGANPGPGAEALGRPQQGPLG